MFYRHMQMNGVRFALQSDRTPEDEIKECKYLGAGLAYLWVKSADKDNWTLVYDYNNPDL